MDDAKFFLQEIFRRCNGGGVTVLCYADDSFRARRWSPGMDPPPGPGYFCISTVKDIPRARVLQRRTEDLVETPLIVLDDIGTKVSRETAATLPKPNYRLETSPGNEQWGYLFKEPVAPSRAAALIEALAQKGLTDPGAKRADRVMRFPGSLNTKYAEPFRARLIEWIVS